MRRVVPALLLLTFAAPLSAQRGGAAVFTRADTLRGSYTTPGRAWWDVTFYDLNVTISPSDSSISGYNGISYRVLQPSQKMQIDLMTPLEVDSMVQDGSQVSYTREGNVYWVTLTAPQPVGATRSIRVYYHGKPRIAIRPPWEGGFTWGADSMGRPWVVTTDQGMGASVWWPNKDTQADEPDSQRVAIRVPDPLINVSNGRLRKVIPHGDGTTTWEWFAANPINNYAIAVAAGNYAHYTDTLLGERGLLTLDFYPLTYNLDNAKRQFPQAKEMLRCFEHWFGPYPWYEDGYKLIEVPNPGMEHQTAVSYGNFYENGYGRRGASRRFDFDFIIIHESAHEWFANNITAKDQADMWVHESFANYAEALFTECKYNSADSGAAYVRTNRPANRQPIIANYEVNQQPPQDMYGKGGLMLHTIRQVVGNTETWRQTLRGLNSTFWHQTVVTKQIEDYMSEKSGVDLSKIFDQYLRTTLIPELEYRINGKTLSYRWANVVPGFDMPVELTLSDGVFTRVKPTESWQTAPLSLSSPDQFQVDPDYYVTAKRVEGDRP